jgi:hypothetical protein
MCQGKRFKLKIEAHKIIFTSSLHGFHRCLGLRSPSPIVKPANSLLIVFFIAGVSDTGDETLAIKSTSLHLKVNIK